MLAPDILPACVREYERRGATIEVSRVTTPDLDKGERLGRECDLIAAFRRDCTKVPPVSSLESYELRNSSDDPGEGTTEEQTLAQMARMPQS